MAFSEANVLSLNSASTNITTLAYVQLSAATPINCTKMLITNTTSQVVVLGYGAASSEIGLAACGPSMSVVVDIGLNVVPAGTRLALRALLVTASSGAVVVSLIP